MHKLKITRWMLLMTWIMQTLCTPRASRGGLPFPWEFCKGLPLQCNTYPLKEISSLSCQSDNRGWFSVLPRWGHLSSSVTQSCLTLCDSMDFRMSGLPVHHQIPELGQTHVHWVSDAIQSSHPLSSPSPPAFNLSQHQRLFQGVSSLQQVAKILEFPASASVLPMNNQDWFPLGWTGCISLQSKGLSSILSNTTTQKHQFFGAQLSLESSTHIHTWLLEKP